MEKLLEAAWVGWQVRLGRISGNHQGGANSDSQVNGDSDMVPSVSLRREGSEKEQQPVTTSILKNATFPALALMPDNSVSPCLFPMAFRAGAPVQALEQV